MDEKTVQKIAEYAILAHATSFNDLVKTTNEYCNEEDQAFLQKYQHEILALEERMIGVLSAYIEHTQFMRLFTDG